MKHEYRIVKKGSKYEAEYRFLFFFWGKIGIFYVDSPDGTGHIKPYRYESMERAERGIQIYHNGLYKKAAPKPKKMRQTITIVKEITLEEYHE
jgi:hypothetical protein